MKKEVEDKTAKMLFTPESGLAHHCLLISRCLLYPSYVSFNCLLSLYITTFQEEKTPNYVLLKKIFLTPVYAAFFVLFLPIMLVFLPIRCALLYVRRPFMCSQHHTPYTDWQTQVLKNAIDKGFHKFGVATANLCLMPELASKMNHLTNVSYRARKIGEKIITSQFFDREWEKEELEMKMYSSNIEAKSCRENGLIGCAGDNTENQQKPVDQCLEGDVSTDFPVVDVFAIQEAWSSYQNKLLIQQLQKIFPYIVHDAGVHAFRNNAFFLNSGLLIASKHPISAVDFKAYTCFVKHGKLLSNGLLMTQLLLGSSKANNRNRYIGYVFNTHLQSYQGKDQIIPKQLDEMLDWIKQFKAENTKFGDIELFCLVCGDFNFDNFSPADRESSQHPLFTEFSDFCRVQANLDKSWTVGTELRPEFMHDNIVSTPEGLKTVLEDQALRQCHLVDADIVEHCKEAIVTGTVKKDAQGNVLIFPEGGRRRIDYILSGRSSPLNVAGYHFVTKLATLTDHIPVAMEFTCPKLH
ncbi:sphingomyelin phosphodiesterase 3-like isoform X2 [Biomphalaria glabrata]|uniref:sphingomyelin phosphodiesterase n=1 Tax=Biomphalaria glabrata TaxID=6526 RepID=A0A9U8E4F5_BIOGL|nr:sphingomyelin phosphodiesterase 3-like isoform X2 [Biomphalaria glabrata]